MFYGIKLLHMYPFPTEYYVTCYSGMATFLACGSCLREKVYSKSRPQHKRQCFINTLRKYILVQLYHCSVYIIILCLYLHCKLARGHDDKAYKCPCASCMLLPHPAPTCPDECWCPVPLTFSNLCWWCSSLEQLVQTLKLHFCATVLHMWWLPSATCAGGLFPSSTGAYTACTYWSLHCVVVIVVVVVYMCLWKVHVAMLVVCRCAGRQFKWRPSLVAF